MTFEYAIRNLSNGKAAKYSTWGGFVFRTDITDGIEEFSETKSYQVGDIVIYLGVTYICTIACSAGIWDPEDWTKTAKYKLTFRKRSNDSSGNPIDNVYTYTPTVISGTVVYHVEPDGLNGSSYSSSEFDDMMPMDGYFLKAICGSDWIIGNVSDFEAARLGAGKVW